MFDKDKKRFENSRNCNSANCSYREDLKNEFSFLISTFNQVLRDPICLAYSTLQLMETRTPEVAQSEYWCSLMNDMKDLIQRLDECDAYGHGKEIDLSDTNLLSLLQEGINSIQATEETCNITFQILCDKISEQNISDYSCDSVKIKIVFMNIIQFLAQVMEETKTVTIQIDADKNKLCTNIDGNIYFNLTFTGDGQPLSNERIASLFEPFPSNRKNQNGLGLVIADRLTETHGGHIQIYTGESETTLTVQLPF